MKTPNRDIPHVMAAMFVAFIIFIHTVMLLAFINTQTGHQIEMGNAKIIIVFLAIVLFAIVLYYYVYKKNGERIVKHYKGKTGERIGVIIGFALFFETLSLPFIIGLFFFH